MFLMVSLVDGLLLHDCTMTPRENERIPVIYDKRQIRIILFFLVLG